jgi:hypothetical protein
MRCFEDSAGDLGPALPGVMPPQRVEHRPEDQRDPERQRKRDDDRHHDEAYV